MSNCLKKSMLNCDSCEGKREAVGQKPGEGRDQGCVRIIASGYSTAYLDVCMVGHDGGPRLEAGHHLRSHAGLAHAHMVFAEEELAVQVAGLNRIQVDLGP